MQVMGATNGLPTGQWTVMIGSIGHWSGASRDINSETVANVGFVSSRKGDYNYAVGAVGMFSGAALFGPIGMVVGGLLPKGFKGQLVEFVIEFQDGTTARAKGKPEEYDKLVKWSMRAPGDTFAGRVATDVDGRKAVRGLATDDDRERLRRALAEEKAAKSSPAAKAERKARRKAVMDQKLSFKETMRLLNEIDAEYR